MIYIRSFNQIDKNDLPIVGGKGAQLGEMIKAGFPVPDGFCVTTDAYRMFVNINKLSEFIAEELKSADIENIESTGRKIREKIEQAEIPEDIKEEIVLAHHKLGMYGYYAVRSSATAEDLPFASFAGQQDTYLNVLGVDSLLNSIRKCWASLFTDRAIIYRLKNGIEHSKLQMSVVIQKMVMPDAAGIMFTADPVNGHRDIISIDAGYGLGEALVSGIVSPDIYKFKKSTLEIKSKQMADKKMAIVPVQEGGTKKADITGDKSTSQVLTDLQIKELADIGIKIEKHFGFPLDIEWCMEKDKLYIVQGRAITSLFPVPEPRPGDGAVHVYSSFNHVQVMTDPISPLGIDILRIILPVDNDVRSEEGYRYMKIAAGRIYMDMSIFLKSKKVRKMVPLIAKNVDALISEAFQELIDRPNFENLIKNNSGIPQSLKRFMRRVAFNFVRNILFRKPEDTRDFMDKYIEERVRRAKELVQRAKPGVDRLEAILEASRFNEDFQSIIPKIAAGIGSFKLLESLELKLIGTGKYVHLIIKGMEGNITTEMGLLTGDLADMIRKSQDLMREFENQDYASLFIRISKLEGHEEFKNEFNAFMNKYDNRAAGEIDMARDRWSEDPEALVKAIMAIVHTAEEGVHRKEFREVMIQAERAADDFIKEVKQKHGRLKSKIVKRLIRVMRNVLPIREHPKYLIMKIILVFKKALLEEGEILVKKGHLTEAKDIFYIGFWELYKALENDESLIELVKQRKEEYAHYKKLTPPRLITSEGEAINVSYKRKNLPEGALVGFPASSGVVEGIARVITDPSKEGINKGEILVAPFTDPGWTPLFINASGLVAEVGGLLTHGSVVAREYGIPAVVSITDVTKKIVSGQRIRVDGDAGYVMILDENKQHE